MGGCPGGTSTRRSAPPEGWPTRYGTPRSCRVVVSLTVSLYDVEGVGWGRLDHDGQKRVRIAIARACLTALFVLDQALSNAPIVDEMTSSTERAATRRASLSKARRSSSTVLLPASLVVAARLLLATIAVGGSLAFGDQPCA